MMNPDQINLFRRLFAIPNRWKNVLYVHAPFCRQKCYYCVYGSKEPDNPAEVLDFYQRRLPAQIQDMGELLPEVPFDQIYFGGGTPTIVDPQVLEGIYNQIPHFDRIPFKAGEASPDTITDEHIDLFARRGFSYISLGVQTLSERVLEANNRPHVSPHRLREICRRLEQGGITANLDLILFLDTGEERDLNITRRDLELLMDDVKPASITLHYHYHIPKRLPLRRAMMETAQEMMGRFPAYSCVNSLLEEEDAREDMLHSAAYRLMRHAKDMDYYMMPKIPWMHPYGHNMLALGEYLQFRVRYNFYYIYDFIDKYTYARVLEQNRSVALDYDRVRRRLGFQPVGYEDMAEFFADPDGRKQFKQIVAEANLPFVGQ